MIELTGYDIVHKIYSDHKVLIYRAHRQTDNQPVILKTINSDYPSPEHIEQIQHEYALTRQLNLVGSVQAYDLLKYENNLVLVLEDIGGDSLRNIIADRRINIETFLRIAIQLAHAVGELHQHRILHKDIKPSNIIVNLATDEVKITDFSISICLNAQQDSIEINPNQIEGTLAYIAPEQSGRMNRVIDYRADLYSLGVSFYEMLVGWLPFQTTDSLELIHFHLAKSATAPHSLNPEIPKILSDIIMKLMEKNPNDRYQTAYGLEYDLQLCLLDWVQTQQIKPFNLGQKDRLGSFSIPHKLYGRTKELSLLLDLFRHVTFGHKVLVTVAGELGMGKTMLVHELQKHIHRKHGLFVAGKFTVEQEQYLPYGAIIQALRDLILQLLTESAEKIAQWQIKLNSALADNAQLIIEVIPELELLLGPAPAVSNLTALENQHRFQLVFLNFIRVFAHHEHPLVIFLDALQWADHASIQLLNNILIDEKSLSIMLILGTRTLDEQANMVAELIQAAKMQHIRYTQINLSPLKLEHIQQIVADSLYCSLEHAHSLAELILTKTEGNPFFVNEFLENLYKERILKFNFAQKCWEWNIKDILTLNTTDNVANLTEQRMQKLSLLAQKLLKCAACIGTQFEIKILSQMLARPEAELAGILWEGVEENLILPLGDAYHNLYLTNINDNQQLDFTHYRFVHDRVHQTAYRMLSIAEKQDIHYQIGRILRENTQPGHLEEHLFEIVHHLNLGVHEDLLPAERFDLARLNLSVGRKAKASTAYELAYSYFDFAIKLLPENTWHRQYHLSLALHIHAMETAYSCAKLEAAEQLFSTILQQANSLLDQVKAYELKIIHYTAQNKMHKALEIGFEVLKLLDINLAENNLEQSFVELKQIMQGRSIESLYQLPRMRDKHKQAALRVLVGMSAPAYLAMPKLYPLICYQQVRLSVEYGNSDLSAYAYASYSMILCGILNDIDAGYQFGQLALNMLDKYNNKDFTAKVLMLVNVCARHCKEPARNTIDPLKLAIQNGVQSGDIEYACYASMFRSSYLFLIGENLAKINQESYQAVEMMQKFGQQYQSNYTKIWLQLVHNLQAKSSDILVLTGDICVESELIPQLLKQNNTLSLFALYFAKALLCYLMREPEQALVNAELAEQHIIGGNAFLHYTTYQFFYALIILANYKQANNKQDYINILHRHQQQLKLWATHAPANYQHKYDLINAEQARLAGQVHQAMAAYEQAINGAKQQGFLQEEALAYELAADFYAELGMSKIANLYLAEAHYAYRRWGAVAKVRYLEQKYPYLMRNFNVNMDDNTTQTAATTLQAGSNFDLLSIMKASQAISSEIMLDKLTKKLLKIVMENIGAQYGVLILSDEQQFKIEAESRINQNLGIKLMQNTLDLSQPSTDLPIDLINYVLRTQTHLVIDDAMQEQRFNADEYIQQHQPKSILLYPLLNQAKLVGLLYLENNLISQAFTVERLNILGLLSSQMAISLNNALFYNKLNIAREQAEAANKAKTSFLMNMSHELRTPLNAILGYSDIIQEDAKDMGYQDILPDLERIQTAGKQLLEIISNILDISKIEADKMELTLTHFQVEQLINDVVTIIQPSIGNNKFQVLCADNLGMMYADRAKLQQILLNLLSNATKFTQNGEISFNITRHRVHANDGNSREDKLKFTISDTGIGMDEQQIKHAFEAFNQLDNSTTRQYGGTGLGLTISERFCNMMGGEINVISELHKGSTFTVLLAAYMGKLA